VITTQPKQLLKLIYGPIILYGSFSSVNFTHNLDPTRRKLSLSLQLVRIQVKIEQNKCNVDPQLFFVSYILFKRHSSATSSVDMSYHSTSVGDVALGRSHLLYRDS